MLCSSLFDGLGSGLTDMNTDEWIKMLRNSKALHNVAGLRGCYQGFKTFWASKHLSWSQSIPVESRMGGLPRDVRDG